MRCIATLLLLAVPLLAPGGAESQVVVKNVRTDRQIKIGVNSHVKRVHTTSRKFNGLYSLVVWGKNKKLK